MHALVIAHGEPVSKALLHELAAAASYLVAADGGLHHAREAGLTPDAVVGDLDSLDAADYSTLPPGVLQQDTNPDATDLEKAVAFARRHGATSIDITCATGGRVDHAIANFSVLTANRGFGALRVVDDQFEVSLVEQQATVSARPGTVVSLIAIGDCTGVTTSGLRWDLHGHTLPFSAYGVHNEIVADTATISVETGDLLLFRGRWVEHHA